MKISKYTFFFNIDGKEYYTYNTLSNSLLEIDEESYSIFYVITVVHSYFHRRCKASSVFLFYSEKYSPLGRPGKSSRVRVCPQVLPVFLAEKPCGQPRPRL